MLPSCRAHQHGRPWLCRLRRPRRAPTAPLLCRPPPPCPLPPPLRCPWLLASLDAGALFSAPRGRRHGARTVPCVGDGSPALRHAGMGRGEARASQGTRPSSSSGPWSHTPPEPPPSWPRRYVCGGDGLRDNGPSASGTDERLRGRMPHGPHVRTPPHRRPHCWDRRQACDRRRRAHPGPGGLCTRWTIHEVSCRYRLFTPLRPALPGRTIFPIPPS